MPAISGLARDFRPCPLPQACAAKANALSRFAPQSPYEGRGADAGFSSALIQGGEYPTPQAQGVARGWIT